MRITEVELTEFTYRVEDVGSTNGNWVYEPGAVLEPPGFVLTIRTADGAEGHYRGWQFAPPAVAQVGMVADSLLGRDPLERRAVWDDLWRRLRHTDHLGLGPIDVALWDLAGRHYGESVAALLGGGREEVPAYVSTYFVDDTADGLSSPAAVADYAEACLEEGWPAFKLHGHPEGRPEVDVAVCEALAERVGDKMDLMLDPASTYRTAQEALRVGRALDELGFYWYEDPMMDTGQSRQLAARLVRDLDTPVLGLEHVRTGPYGSVDHLASEGLDLVRGSAHLDGGITGVLKTAESAASFGADVELLLGGAAHLHLLGALRNANYFEYGMVAPDAGFLNDQALVDPVETVADGRIPVPDGPGLGIEIDWDVVEERETDRRRWD